MSTRSRIAMKQNDNTYKSIYCHHDGYLEYNGVMLYKFYNDPIKLKLLLDLGDISTLGESIFPSPMKNHDFTSPQKNVTVAYHRDRGEDKHFFIHENKESLINSCSKSDQEFLYLYEDNEWKYADVRTKFPEHIEVTSLKDKLIERNIIEEPEKDNDYINGLTKKLVQYAEDCDFYNFSDICNSKEDTYNKIKKDLLQENVVDIYINTLIEDILCNALEKDMSNPEVNKLTNTALGLVKELNQYNQVLKKENQKEISL